MSDESKNPPPTAAGEPGPADASPERADPRLLELLVCPVTKTTLIYDASAQELISRAAHLAFPIRMGVAMLSIDAARGLPD
jgi:uncharacterized protein